MDDEIKIGNIYLDNLKRTHIVVRLVSKEIYNKDEATFWELETISWVDCPHQGEPMMNTFWKSAKYIKDNYKRVSKKTIFMTNTMSKVRELFRKEPEKTFIKAGFIDEKESLTEDGKEVLLSILWKEKEKELKEIADKIVTA